MCGRERPCAGGCALSLPSGSGEGTERRAALPASAAGGGQPWPPVHQAQHCRIESFCDQGCALRAPRAGAGVGLRPWGGPGRPAPSPARTPQISQAQPACNSAGRHRVRSRSCTRRGRARGTSSTSGRRTTTSSSCCSRPSPGSGWRQVRVSWIWVWTRRRRRVGDCRSPPPGWGTCGACSRSLRHAGVQPGSRRGRGVPPPGAGADHRANQQAGLAAGAGPDGNTITHPSGNRSFGRRPGGRRIAVTRKKDQRAGGAGSCGLPDGDGNGQAAWFWAGVAGGLGGGRRSPGGRRVTW